MTPYPTNEVLPIKSYHKAPSPPPSILIANDKGAKPPLQEERQGELHIHAPLRALSLEKRTRLQYLQEQISWHQAKIAYLQEVSSTLALMNYLVQKSANSDFPEEVDHFDEAFQHCKRSLSALIDGYSGNEMPQAIFHGTPLLLGYRPSFLNFTPSSIEPMIDDNLFTGYGLEGFANCPLAKANEAISPCVEGYTQKGDSHRLTLDEHAAMKDHVYQGLWIEWGPEHLRERAQIKAYQGATRTATFAEEISSFLHPEQYRITHHRVNHTLKDDQRHSLIVAAIWEIPFAAHLKEVPKLNSIGEALNKAQGYIANLINQEQLFLAPLIDDSILQPPEQQNALKPVFSSIQQSIQALSGVSKGASKLLELLTLSKREGESALKQKEKEPSSFISSR